MVVVTLEEAQLGAGADAAVFEEFEELAIALVDPTHGVRIVEFGIGEQDESATAAAGRAFHLAEIAVRTGTTGAQLGQKLGFEVGRDGVFEALGFVVNLPPFHSKHFGEHALDQMMAERKLAGDLASLSSKADFAAGGVDAHEAIFLEAAQSHGDGGWGDFEEISQAGGNYGFAFTFGFQDRLEIVFLGDGDHWRGLYDLVNSLG